MYTARELAVLADTMAERGIRLRRTLEDILEEHGVDEGRAENGARVDEGETELEYESRERRRLMPY